MNLGTIEEEAAACRAAFAAVDDDPAYRNDHGALALHIHHQMLVERLVEAPEVRIEYILDNKPKSEQALRLRLMRPVTTEQATELRRVQGEAWDNAGPVRRAAWSAYYDSPQSPADAKTYQDADQGAIAEVYRVANEAHRPLCDPDCPWNGEIIFPEEQA